MSGRGRKTKWRGSIAAALLISVLGATAFGCGGGGSGSSEEDLRAQLEAGAAKLARAPSLHASLLYQVESEESSVEPGEEPCVNIAVDRRKGPLRVEVLSFDQSCDGGGEGQDVIMIGDHAWVATDPGRFSQAKIAARLPRQLTDEAGKFRKLLAAASNIHQGKSGAYSAPDGDFEEGPGIEFTAPARSFSQIHGTGSTDVAFRAVLDRQGYLRELVATVGEEDPGVILTQTYEDIGRPQGIMPPDRKEVFGPVTRIRSRRDLEALVELPGGA